VAAATEAIPRAENELQDTETEEERPPGPHPDPVPEGEPETPSESPGAPEAPVSPPAPDQEQPAVQPAPAAGNGDDAAQRLVAMKLAVDGRDRAEIEAELTEKFGEADRTALLDDVLSRVPR
jgi:hypothetical protein